MWSRVYCLFHGKYFRASHVTGGYVIGDNVIGDPLVITRKTWILKFRSGSARIS